MTSRGSVFVSKEYLKPAPVTERDLLNLASWKMSLKILTFNWIGLKTDNTTVNRRPKKQAEYVATIRTNIRAYSTRVTGFLDKLLRP